MATLIQTEAERQDDITYAERRELDSYENLEHFVCMIKAEAHRRLVV